MKPDNKTTCQYLKKRNKKTKQTPPKKKQNNYNKKPLKNKKKQTGIRRLSVKIILYPYLKSTPCWFLSAISS